MSSSILPGPGAFVGKDPHTQIVTTKQMAQQRSFLDQSLPCKPLHETFLRAEPPAPRAFTPLFGNARKSSYGLSRNPEHPTTLPVIKHTDPFNPGKTIKL